MENSLLKEIDRREGLEKVEKEVKALKRRKREEQTARTAGRKMKEREAKERKAKRTKVIKKIKKFEDVAGVKKAMKAKGRRVSIKGRKAMLKRAIREQRRVIRLRELKRRRVDVGMLGAESPFFEQREQRLSRMTEGTDLLTGRRKKRKEELTFLGKGNI